jgi:hypothetical protein
MISDILGVSMEAHGDPWDPWGPMGAPWPGSHGCPQGLGGFSLFFYGFLKEVHFKELEIH